MKAVSAPPSIFRRMIGAGVHAALIGEALMRATDRRALLESFFAIAQRSNVRWNARPNFKVKAVLIYFGQTSEFGLRWIKGILIILWSSFRCWTTPGSLSGGTFGSPFTGVDSVALHDGLRSPERRNLSPQTNCPPWRQNLRLRAGTRTPRSGGRSPDDTDSIRR